MKESNKMKVLKVMNIMNIAFCCLAAGIGMFENNVLGACGWLTAALAYMQVNDLRRYCEDWNDIGRKAVYLFNSLFGTGGQIVGIEVKSVEKKSEEENKDPEKKLPDFAPKVAESLNECAEEFFHYVEEGNREFSISHGGVTLIVSIPDDDPVLEKVEVAEGPENGAAEQK